MSILHCHLDIRGALRSLKKRQLSRMFCDDGRWLTADEAREVLFDHLANGRMVLPIGEPCDARTVREIPPHEPGRGGMVGL